MKNPKSSNGLIHYLVKENTHVPASKMSANTMFTPKGLTSLPLSSNAASEWTTETFSDKWFTANTYIAMHDYISSSMRCNSHKGVVLRRQASEGENTIWAWILQMCVFRTSSCRYSKCYTSSEAHTDMHDCFLTRLAGKLQTLCSEEERNTLCVRFAMGWCTSHASTESAPSLPATAEKKPLPLPISRTCAPLLEPLRCAIALWVASLYACE